jgi:signal transduction histidine kinase
VDPVVWIVTREFRRLEGPPAPGEPRREGPRPGGLERGAFDRGAFDRNVSLVTVALALPGGRHAQVESPLFLPALQVPSDAWVSLVLLIVVAAAFCVWAVRLAVQPVRMLAEAAERLSRNIDEPPLAETGAVEIRAATRAFNRMQDRLRRHVNSRALAFAAMSHDIRTPLTRLRLRLETLGEDARASLEEDLAEIASIAESALEVTRGLAPEEAIASVDLHPFVKRLLDGYLSLGDAIELKGASQTVAARPAALRRVLVNLIDNALKYGKDVTVEIADAQGYVDIRVCDRGPGIPEEHLPKVVYPFYRVESSRNRGTGGTGLGLAIAKDIVEGHGGELLIGNRPTGGLCVTVRLPR